MKRLRADDILLLILILWAVWGFVVWERSVKQKPVIREIDPMYCAEHDWQFERYPR